MAKNNNITDLLTDVADAIREKKGTTDKINPQNFSAEIKSIKSGGEGVYAWNDVNFYDYDGTIVYSCTWEDAMQMDAMPDGPEHEELAFEGWNYTLDELKEQGGRCDVGALYGTISGATELVIDTRKSKVFRVQCAGTVNWGDGNEEYFDSNTEHSHIYDTEGVLVVRVYASSNIIINKMMNIREARTTGRIKFFRCAVWKLSTSSTSILSFDGCALLEHVTLSPADIEGDQYKMFSCASLVSVSYPATATKIPGANNACNFAHLHIPSKVSNLTISGKKTIRLLSVSKTNSKYYVQDNCLVDRTTDSVIAGVLLAKIPEVSEIAGGSFQAGIYLGELVIPDTITSIGSGFNDCIYRTAYIGKNVLNLPANAFGYSQICEFYDFRNHTEIPVMAATSVFNGIQSTCKIVVPDALYDDWIVATNWTNFASKIVKASEFNAK